MMKLTSSGLTHVGMKRSHNEDCLRISRDENLFIVADGMGGHASGEVASEMSAETLVSFYQTSSLDENLTWPYRYDYSQSYEENRIRVGVQLSNHRIYSASTYDVKLKGMGTTMVAMSFYDQSCSIGHVGDSRVYLYRKGRLIQLTEDHSLLNDYIKMKPGGMTEEEIEAFPHKNVIVRALGMKSDVIVDVITEEVEAGDLYILCSDGLSGMITDAQMAILIQKQLEDSQSLYQLDLDTLCAHLINTANQNGGNDNITAVVVRCDSLKANPASIAQLNPHSNLTPVWVQTDRGFQRDITESSEEIKLQKKVNLHPKESNLKELPPLAAHDDVEDHQPTLQTIPSLNMEQSPNKEIIDLEAEDDSTVQSFNETDEFHSYAPLPSLETLEEDSSDPTLNMKPMSFTEDQEDQEDQENQDQ
jgi:protein phosphatase